MLLSHPQRLPGLLDLLDLLGLGDLELWNLPLGDRLDLLDLLGLGDLELWSPPLSRPRDLEVLGVL